MPDTETPADRLRAAATRVREGWAQGALVEHGDRVCAIGALLDLRATDYAAAQWEKRTCSLLADRPIAFEAAVALNVYLMTTEGEHRQRVGFVPGAAIAGIELWNDHEGTRADEVAEMMEKAAAAWEELPDGRG